jgi:hypothetical protein
MRIMVANAQFRSVAKPWADTGTSTGRVMLAVLRCLQPRLADFWSAKKAHRSESGGMTQKRFTLGMSLGEDAFDPSSPIQKYRSAQEIKYIGYVEPLACA